MCLFTFLLRTLMSPDDEPTVAEHLRFGQAGGALNGC